MKKTYTKPAVIIESFQLNAAVAASCSSQGFIPIGYGETTCEFGGQFFSHENCQFDLTGSEGDGNDTDCYHGPLIAGVTFLAS